MMKILMVASEVTPYAKTGGLADVVGALPFALAEQGEQVGVVLPLYPSAVTKIQSADHVFDRMPIWFNSQLSINVDIKRVVDRGVSFFFVDCPTLYNRASLYGENGEDYPDNHIRFAVLCRAVLGVIRSLFRPDVVHYHDWQASLVAPYMREQFRNDPTFTGIKTLLTIHNLGYQGLFPKEALSQIGLAPALFHGDPLEFWGRINLLKGGIVFADAITTVSKGYAREIQTPEYGFGLDGLLRSRASAITGILNGVDYGEWSPETDRYIAAHYSASDLSGKRICKQDLLSTFGLPTTDLARPVIGMVSRFVHQKGLDILEPILDRLMQEDVLLAVIGSGEPHFEEMMLQLADRFPQQASVRIGYDNSIAHKIEAGADMFLMPSQYEPCGLNQIYSLRYGTIPIVRATGGLDDTIDGETGFKFQDYSPEALLSSIGTAIAAWREPKLWRTMMLEGMRRDHSWTASAAEYSALYRRIGRVAAES